MGGFYQQNEEQVLQLANILRQQTFGACHNTKAYTIFLRHGFKTLCLNCGSAHALIHQESLCLPLLANHLCLFCPEFQVLFTPSPFAV